MKEENIAKASSDLSSGHKKEDKRRIRKE